MRSGIRVISRGFDAFHRALLGAASLLVPGPGRTEWHREWRGELWHVQQSCAWQAGPSWQCEREVTAFCLGAFQDALCLRRTQPQPAVARAGTPGRCVLLLCAALLGVYLIALLLPGVRAERDLWPRRANGDLIMIQQAQASFGVPTIARKTFLTWQRRRYRSFDGFAFYTTASEAVEPIPADRTAPAHESAHKPLWRIGNADAKLFSLLGLPIRFAPAVAMDDGAPQLILSERRWKYTFAAAPHVAGTELLVNGRLARIVGVVADNSIDLPGAVDAWELGADPATSPSNPASLGYVVAHLTAEGATAMWSQRMPIDSAAGEDDLVGVALNEWKPSPWGLYLFALFLALLALPAITSVSLGENGVNPHKASWPANLHRWSFFAAKIALLLPAVYFISLDLAYGYTRMGREPAIYLQLLSTFALCLFGLRWTLKDQRQRCPVCMNCVTHPAQVGQASRTFLDWNGTEMMCTGGHTLLHVPSQPTSWFGAQRWLYLDTSWDFLFAGSTPPIP
jgi:hypothetical protein